MSTLNHECFANGTTPLWMSASGGGNYNSPLNVVNNLNTPTTKTTMFDTNVTGGVYFAPFSSGETQAYGEVQFDITPAVHIKTNGKDIITATPSNVTITKPILIDNPQTTQINQITTNTIGNPANSDATIQFGTDYINLGTTAYVGSGDGVVVYSGGFSNYSEMLPQSFTFGTSATTPIPTTENFSTATIGVLGWTSQTGIPFDGYIWSSENPSGDAQGGLTLTDPAQSVKAVTNTNAPSSGKSAWLGGFLGTAGGQYTSYLEFPPIVAPIGTQVSVTWKQAGSVFSIDLYKNDVIAIANSGAFRPVSSNWTTPSIFPYTFTSTGTDYLYLAVQNPTGGSYTYTNYNISDIVITKQGQVETAEGGMQVDNAGVITIARGEPSTNPTNITFISSTEIDINASDGLTNSASIGVYDGGLAFNTTGRIDAVAGLLNITAPVNINSNALNMNNNNIDNIGNVNANQVFALATYTNDVYPNSGFSNVSFQSSIDLQHNNIYNCSSINNSSPGGSMNIGLTTDNVNLSNGKQINTLNIDANYGSRLYIGYFSPRTDLSNVVNITGLAGGSPTLDGFLTYNYGAPMVQGFQLQYVVNWSGNKPNTMYVPPNANSNVFNQTIFGTGFTGADYVQTSSYILPPKSRLQLYTSGSNFYTATNSNASPTKFTNSAFDPNSTTQSYTLTAYLPGI